MRFFRAISVIAVAGLMVFGSCAKAPTEDFVGSIKESWKLWIEAYVKQPGNEDVKPFGGEGIYVREVAAAAPAAKAVEPGNWVRVNFTGRTMRGDVYCTRNKNIAELQNTYTARTHYVPQYLYIPKDNEYSNLPYGMLTVLKSMKQGESLIAYIPSYLAYGSSGTSFSGGYQGQNALGSWQNININMELVEVIEDIEKHEIANLENFVFNTIAQQFVGAKQPADLAIAKADTVRENMYVKRDLYPSLVPVGVTRDSIPKDTTIGVYFKGYFLDGFVFDTNIDSVAKRLWNDNTAKTPFSVTLPSGNAIKAFLDVIPTMVFDQWALVAFPSKYGYGYSGSTEGKTVIQPYSPLVFEIYIPTNIKKEEEKN